MERWNISIVKFVLIRSDMAAMLKSNIVCENIEMTNFMT